MLTFGAATLVDGLSWLVAAALGLKVVATATLLIVDKSARDRPGWGASLWWVTKGTPVLAVPCLIGIAAIQHDRTLFWIAIGLGTFVFIAVPLKVRQRRKRMAVGSIAELPTARS